MNAFDITRLQKVRGIGPKRYQSILTKLDEIEKDIDDLFKMPAADVKAVFGLPRNVAEAIANASEQPQAKVETVKNEENTVDQLAAKGIKTLVRGASDYPKHLQSVLEDKAPSIYYVWGNLDLLQKPAVGFCGSRDASKESIAATADMAKQIANLGWVVVSGHARGVDTAAHLAALENGGSTIVVAPEGLLNFRLRKELKKIAKPEQLLIISEFAPHSRWSVVNAMTRNRTIIGLSDAMILVEARMEGGTFQAGETTLYLKKPLFVALYQKLGPNADGNKYFVQKGATALAKNPTTGEADIERLKATVSSTNRDVKVVSEAKPEQLSLLI
jgi:DNA protecting protein DprA